MGFFSFRRKSKSADDSTSSSAEVAPLAPKLRKTRVGFASRLVGFLRGARTLDDDLRDELEELLLMADVGVEVTQHVISELDARMSSGAGQDAVEILRTILLDILEPVAGELLIDADIRPFVILVVGVNGVGKTTTIGKLASKLRAEDMDVMLAAGDTFRAAAIEQLQTWGERNQVPVVSQQQGADSASVIFDAVQSATARGTDVVIADTAGRLHTQAGLMDELVKVRRVIGKLDATAPHETLLVLDGSTGQNALRQAREFTAAMNVSGLVITKLDGSAKGGMLFALASDLGVPVRFIGVGESVDDLRVFNPAEFVDALLEPTDAGAP